MNNLWAPWRMEYITRPKDQCCIFCTAQKESNGYILTSGKHCFSIMNRFPYTSGHCMVAPYRHVSDLTDLNQEELSEMMSMTQEILAAIRTTMNPEGFNVGCNLGTAAGAGIADHLHMHIVPRWKGDTNFMPVLGSVHVISEYITCTRDKIRENLP